MDTFFSTEYFAFKNGIIVQHGNVLAMTANNPTDKNLKACVAEAAGIDNVTIALSNFQHLSKEEYIQMGGKLSSAI